MKFFFTVLFYFISIFSKAQSVLQMAWDLNSNAGNEASVPPTTVDPNLAPVFLQRGSGLSAASLANSFNSSGWTTTNSLADAILNNDYIEWIVQPRSGFVSSLHQLSANFRRSATGPDHFQWRYSIDGSTFQDLGTEILFVSTATNGVAQSPMDLLAIAAIQNFTSATTVHFRLYGYNASATSGTFALGRLAGNDLSLTGSTQATTPQVLLSFNVKAGVGAVELSWMVTAERAVAKYVIERAGADGNFQVIGELPAKNQEYPTRYLFKDSQQVASAVFYRLKMQDIDGQYRYSSVEKMRPFLSRSNFKMRRISFDQSVVHFPIEHEGGSLKLVSLEGRILRQWMVVPEQQQLYISTGALSPGIYILQFISGRAQYIVKIYQ